MGLRLLRGRFKGKGAVGGMGPFPVADSPETTPPRPWAHKIYARCTEVSVSDSKVSFVVAQEKLTDGSVAIKGVDRC